MIFTYYTFQGILFYTTLYIFTLILISPEDKIEKNKVKDYLHQNNITFSYFLFINLLTVIKRVLLEELILRWFLYNKVCSYFFTQNTALIVYTIVSYLLIKNTFVSFVDKLIWISQLLIHAYIYKSTSSLYSSIIVGIYGNMLRIL